MSRKQRKNVGLIGLGIIGTRVAASLRANGYQTFVWNRTPKPAPNFLGSPQEVVELCEIIQLFVADAAALFEVIESIRDLLKPHHVIICSATVGPEDTIEAARLVEDKGAKFLDAPFTGSKGAAENRQLVYYVGGDDATFLRAKPVLEASSKAIVRIGGIGQAATVKVVTNMIAAVSIQTLAEALAIVKKSGIDPEVFGTALEHNACRSGTMDLKFPKMVSGDFEPHFSLKHMFKDVKLGVHIANTLDIEVPATTVTAGVLYGSMGKGWADLDFSALFKVYDPHFRNAATPELKAPTIFNLDLDADRAPQPGGAAPSSSPGSDAGATTKTPPSAGSGNAVIGELSETKSADDSSHAHGDDSEGRVAAKPETGGEKIENGSKPGERLKGSMKRWFGASASGADGGA